MYIGDFWLQLWLKNCCKNAGYYFVFQLILLLLLNNYQYNCNNTISSMSAQHSTIKSTFKNQLFYILYTSILSFMYTYYVQ